MDVPSLDFDSCYRAVAARDARFDGLFFTAVRTTGIYCRSVCPARTPQRSSCTFFATAAAAEKAGFRPCLRCRPEGAPGRGSWTGSLAAAALAAVQEGALDDGGVEQLAARMGLSSRQVRRLLVQHFGVTPVEAAQTQRLLFAKKLLHETRLPMTEVALAAGFQSLRRFNAVFHDRYGMAPSALRRAAHEEVAPESDGLVLRLAYRPPLAWREALDYLSGRATPGVEWVRAGVYARSVALPSGQGRALGWIAVRHHASDAALEVRIAPTLVPVLLTVTQKVRAVFDLDADPDAIGRHLSSDPMLAPLVARRPGLRLAGAWDVFELATRAVLGQQVSVRGATTLAGRLAERFGEPLPAALAQPGVSVLAVEPARLARAEVGEVQAIGIPGKRAETLIALARFALEGGLTARLPAQLDEFVERLTALPGIGPWTAHYVAMRALRHPDALPLEDLGLLRAFGALSGGARATAAQLKDRAEAWSPWRGYAAAHLWHSETTDDTDVRN